MPTGQAGKHMPRGPLNRRDFISCLGGAAAWPLAARGQQAERIRRIRGLLDVASLIRAALALYLICRGATDMIRSHAVPHFLRRCGFANERTSARMRRDNKELGGRPS